MRHVGLGEPMILTAHQPGYLPWLGLFHKISLAERFCIFDIAQYQKKEFDNRNKIKTQTGPIWLSVPVESKNHFDTKLCDVKIVHNGWSRKHAKSIRLSYSKAPFFKTYIDQIEERLLGKSYEFLTDLNTELLVFFLEQLDIKVPIIKASDIDFRGRKSALVLDMCVKLGATTYIFGQQGRNYADRKLFLDNGIDIRFQDYAHPHYRQLFGSFEPYMSVIDLLFNEGPDSRSVIMQGNARYASELANGVIVSVGGINQH